MAAAPRKPTLQATATQPAQVKPNAYSAPGPLGNTTGLIVPDTAPNPTLNSAPAITPTTKEEGWWKRWGSAVVHGALDVAGFVPVLGAVPDLLNAGIYAAEGDYVQAGISAVAAIPVAGDAVAAGNIGVKVGAKIAKETAEQAEKRIAKEAAEKLEKDAAERAAKAEKEAAAKRGGKDKGRKKLKCGEYGKYGDLKKKTGDNKFDRDHIPSKAALKERAESLAGEKLSQAQKQAIDKAGDAIAIPRQAHIDVSPTYGQSGSAAAKDAGNLAGSARRDVEAMLKEIDKYDADGNCKKAYQKAAAKLLRMSNADYDKILLEILKKVK
jgi:hypothetical protein